MMPCFQAGTRWQGTWHFTFHWLVYWDQFAGSYNYISRLFCYGYLFADIPEEEARLFTENLDKWNDMSEDEVSYYHPSAE